MHLLQKAGVPAAAVQNSEDIYFDAHLRARGYIVPMDHPDTGRVEHPGLTFRLSDHDQMSYAPLARLGQHTDDVFGEMLGLSSQERQALVEEGVLA
jgi:crotonobetainyl-CoA:carnitine CoA-transferase CaiB-like acyl-CoA transferase